MSFGKISFNLFILIFAFSRNVDGMAINQIKIKGQINLEQLPISMTKSFATWTFENSILGRVEDENSDGAGWISPSTCDQLFLPSDMPLPKCQPALGIGVVNGLCRYVMPSVILTLETPDKKWRNRGLCTLPRAVSWIDLFGPFCPPTDKLTLSYFGQYAPDVRFLEDQDGTSAWEALGGPAQKSDFEIAEILEDFKDQFRDPKFDVLRDGYHFVDIPMNSRTFLPLPRYRLKAFLSDFADPIRLLGLEDPNALDLEPCADLDIYCKVVSPARDSKFLPEAYLDLFDEGNLVG